MIPYELSILIAIAAFVYSVLLTEPNAIFNKPYRWLYNVFKTDQRQEQGRSIHPLFMFLIYCEKCVAGQWAFWLYLYINWHLYIHEFAMYIVIKHILFTLFTIFITALVKQLYLKIKHDEQ